MIHRSGAWGGRAEAGSDRQLHVQLSRDSEAAGPSAEPVLQGWGAGGAGSSAASSSHWHDFLRSGARKDLKTELQPSNKFQLCLWEEALLAWPLVPCPYTFRRREQLRWVHIPRLSSWPAPAATLWTGKLGTGRWAESNENPCRNRCTSSVFLCVWCIPITRTQEWRITVQTGKRSLRAGNAEWDRSGQQGQAEGRSGAAGKGQETASLVVRWRSALVQGMQVAKWSKGQKKPSTF